MPNVLNNSGTNSTPDECGHRVAITDALVKAIEIFTSHSEKKFDDVISKGIKLIAEAAGLDRIVFYR